MSKSNTLFPQLRLGVTNELVAYEAPPSAFKALAAIDEIALAAILERLGPGAGAADIAELLTEGK